MARIDYPHILCRAQPGVVSFAVMLLGFILLALSFVWGVGQVSVELISKSGEIVKEVGYGSALNWSLTMTLVLPAALLYLCKMYQAFPTVLRGLAVNHMVVTEDLSPISEKDLKALWQKKLSKYRHWLAILMGVGLLFCVWEWYSYSARPLWLNDSTQASEQDWSVGVLFNDSGKSIQAPALARAENGALSLMAFLGQAVIVAALLTFIYKALIIGVFFTEISKPEGPYRLLPNPKSHDKRLGFELLSELIEEALICIGLFYGTFYLSRLQNILEYIHPIERERDAVIS